MLTILHRRRRPLGWIVLAVLLVLLPLRGWAEARMHLPLGLAEAAMPCHGAEADVGDTHPAMDSTPGAESPDRATCALCALCHGSGLPASEFAPLYEGDVPPGAARTADGTLPPILPLPERPPRV